MSDGPYFQLSLSLFVGYRVGTIENVAKLCGDTKGVLTRVLQVVPTAEAPPRITHIYHVGAGYVASETTPTRGFVPGLPACSSQ